MCIRDRFNRSLYSVADSLQWIIRGSFFNPKQSHEFETHFYSSGTAWDVYKRQVYGCADSRNGRHRKMESRIFFITGRFSLHESKVQIKSLDDVHKSCIDRFISVSYTHLDVYKRQVHSLSLTPSRFLLAGKCPSDDLPAQACLHHSPYQQVSEESKP